ncbi:hypothetical protein PIB30_091206 [Stylosanthes scabra]|uniref:Reverse transcriptase/retrotransposon-derived protein RNase H-like domain-containing protein n=1 Tax=Stylosanthes scabra TaxID=79078 RepID=A0ABU6UTC1_9FABA|nr:hypothetical protein [Stylosanthes scabra]
MDMIKAVLTSSHTMTSPKPSAPLKVYIAVGEESVSGLIAQEKEGKEKPIANVNRAMKGPEQRYSLPEKHFLALGIEEKKRELKKKWKKIKEEQKEEELKMNFEGFLEQSSRRQRTIVACNTLIQYAQTLRSTRLWRQNTKWRVAFQHEMLHARSMYYSRTFMCYTP